jgi:hypothetical protein
MRITNLVWVVVLGAACTESVEGSRGAITASELLASPEAFEEGNVTVVDLVHPSFFASGRACFDEVTGAPVRPCNIAFGSFELRDGDAAMRLVAAADFHVSGETGPPRTTRDSIGGSVALGCSGDDVELGCVPTVPSAILAVTGRVDGEVFAVSTVEIDPAVLESTDTLAGEPVRLFVAP